MRGLVIVMAVGEGLGSWDLQGALMRRQLEKNESQATAGRIWQRLQPQVKRGSVIDNRKALWGPGNGRPALIQSYELICRAKGWSRANA
jgi:hypothetical protein